MQSESRENLVAFESDLHDKTIIGYFDDPLVPYALKKLIHREKRLLRLYE